MRYWAVVRDAGSAWADGGIVEQPHVSEHAAFMGTLVEDGLVRFGGPLDGTEAGRVRVLLIVAADSESEIRMRLADDPWEASEQIVTSSAEPWSILVGEERLGP